MSDGAGPVTVKPAVARPASRDALVIASGACLTALLALVLARRPLEGLVLLATVAVLAAVSLNRPRIARTRVGSVLTAGVVLLPAAALLGPSFALPMAPQVFVFRILLAAVVALGATLLIVRRAPIAFAAKDVALPIVLWFAWVLVGLLWASDDLAGLSYAAVVVTMLAVLAATAVAGGTRRRLRALGLSLVLVYAFVAGFSLLEAGFGIRLPTSRLLTTVTSQTYAVTSVFHNQNDLATFLAICWPFMLCAFFFTHRARWLLLDVLFIALGVAAFVRTGSRSSLVAAAISTVAATVMFTHPGHRLSTRARKLVTAAVAVALIAGALYLLSNDSRSPMLRQFRLENLVQQVRAGTGSGELRTDLNSRGLEIAGGSYLIGAGPGQAEGIIASGAEAPGITNLHDWWLETYAEGGIVGFALHAAFFVVLLAALWSIARRDPDALVRYLASGTLLALLGFTVGALGPSSAVSFTPMWVLYGLGLAVVSRSRLAAATQSALVPGGGV